MNGSIVVTGAARGIGRAIAERLAANPSFTVIGVDVAPELGLADADITPVQVDLTTNEGIDVVKEAVTGCGAPLMGLVNNAGITRDARLVNMSDEDFRAVLDVNLGAAFRLSTALAGLFTEGASIVNIASRAYLGNFGQFNYSMSKGGVVGLTRAMALSLAPHVRVNAIAPGLIGTEMAMA
ncbi:MAG: SDR family NAD(P)-dependent oxidoreductase, partial [Acidimicrobiia bacterium]